MKKTISLLGCALGASLLFANSASAQDCDTITLGSAISLTGIYATNGIHTRNGYEFAIQKIREAGGVKVGDKCYNFNVIYVAVANDPLSLDIRAGVLEDAARYDMEIVVDEQLQDGKYNVVAPSQFASHKINWPRTPK